MSSVKDYMIQHDQAPVFAHEVLWTYRATNEEETEKEFYIALEQPIIEEITWRFQKDEAIWVGRELNLRIGTYTIHARLTNVEPVLATRVNGNTRMLVRYQEQVKGKGQDVSTFLSEIIRYPNKPLGEMYEALVGIDAIKRDMFRKLTLLLFPDHLDHWMSTMYPQNPPLMLEQALHSRYPLIILEGEVGSGKTALARSIGHRVATKQQGQTELALFVVNAQVRGGGHVGELTQNISRAFAEAERCQERENIPVMLLIDEADALAQMRGGRQTHHEDDAGVNTLIQRIDRLRGRPMAIIFATNLAQSLDSAILRRAIASYHFDRPDSEQRAEAFQRLLANIDIDGQTIMELVARTQPRRLPGFGEMSHRYTYSDLSQRIIPRAVEEAVYSAQPLTPIHLLNACQVTTPTPEVQMPS